MAIQQIQQPLTQREQTERKRRLFTIDEYNRMIEEGILGEDERLELIRGEIEEMPPIGPDHSMEVARVNRVLVTLAGTNALVWPQCAIQLSGKSQTQPDVALLREHEYSSQEPATASDVLLVIEVSDTTVKSDRTVKGPLYAEAGIPEYWLVDLRGGVVEVYTDPVGGAYRSVKQARRGDTLALPQELGMVQVSDILPKEQEGAV